MILALDLGTSTGFAHGRGDSLPVVDSVTMPTTGDDVGAFLAFFRGWFVPTVRRLEPEFLVFEAPILPASKWNAETKKVEGQTNLMTTRKLQSLAGVLELMCKDLELPCFEVHLGTAKKALTGNGAARKSDMLQSARRQGLELSAGNAAFDEADAFAIWLVGVQEKRADLWPLWEQRLAERGSR